MPAICFFFPFSVVLITLLSAFLCYREYLRTRGKLLLFSALWAVVCALVLATYAAKVLGVRGF
jgi:hypothetical protein